MNIDWKKFREPVEINLRKNKRSDPNRDEFPLSKMPELSKKEMGKLLEIKKNEILWII